MEKPIMIENPDLTKLKKMVQHQINEISNPDYCDDNDNDYYIYEVAMEAFFGKDVFRYINSKIK